MFLFVMEVGSSSDFLEITRKIASDRWSIILAGIFVVLAIIYSRSGKRRKLPPGPFNLPILGYYPFLGKDHIKTVNELAKKYGNIIGFYIGSQYIVISNDWPTATEVLSKALDRPLMVFEDAPYHIGFGGINGSEWANSRRISSKAMKDIGLHRTRWELLVQEEVNHAVEELMKRNQEPVKVKEFFTDFIATNILTLILGQRLPSGASTSRLVMRTVDAIIDNATTLKMLNFSKRLSKILKVIGFEKNVNIAREAGELASVVSNIVEKKIGDPLGENEDSFVDQINDDLQQRAKQLNLKNNYKEHTIKGNSIALLTGGSETNRTSLVWLLIAMADHPEIQKKVHEELDKALGSNGTITWAQRKDVPYTLATILEAQRWKTIVPLSSLRQAPEDIHFQDYVIPKGTYISANIWAVHNDPKYWKKPEKFMPERFLTEDGKDVQMTPDSFMPFSYGKRNCPGQLIAYMSILQNFSILMQKFKVAPKEGKKVQYNGVLSLTYQAFNAELRFIPRQ